MNTLDSLVLLVRSHWGWILRKQPLPQLWSCCRRRPGDALQPSRDNREYHAPSLPLSFAILASLTSERRLSFIKPSRVLHPIPGLQPSVDHQMSYSKELWTTAVIAAAPPAHIANGFYCSFFLICFRRWLTQNGAIFIHGWSMCIFFKFTTRRIVLRFCKSTPPPQMAAHIQWLDALAPGSRKG